MSEPTFKTVSVTTFSPWIWVITSPIAFVLGLSANSLVPASVQKSLQDSLGVLGFILTPLILVLPLIIVSTYLGARKSEKFCCPLCGQALSDEDFQNLEEKIGQ
jgi:hypothetical protein